VSPDRDERPGVGRLQPGRAARGPGQQEVALVAELLGLGEADAGQGAHPGVHAVYGVTPAEHLARGRALPVHPVQQRGREAGRPAGGDLENEVRAEVSGRGDLWAHQR
jgi:hypothetical protein